MKHHHLLSTFAALLALSHLASAQSATTDPVGFVTINISATSTQSVALPMLNSSLVSAAIASNSNTTITLTGVSNVGSYLTSGAPYYMELTSSGTYEGHRFDIDTAATITSANGTVTLSGTSPNYSTLTGTLPNLADYTAVIRQHHTIASIFGTGTTGVTMKSATTSDAADQVWIWTGSGFSTYWFRQNTGGTSKNWRNTATGTTVQDGTVIPAGMGIFVKRADITTFSILMSGGVRNNKFVQNISAGTSLVSNGYPTDLSPSQMVYDYPSGFFSATTSDAADQIWTWTGNGVSTYWYRQNSGGTTRNWRNTATGTTDQTSTAFLSGTQAYFTDLASAVTTHTVPKPF